jgi:ribosomal protein S18 acetylase RimI-like enzyme
MSAPKEVASPDQQGLVVIRPVKSADLAAVKACFQEYTDWLDEDISFQNYTEEFGSLPGKYSPPDGGLILAVDASCGDILGCIAFRPLELHGDYVHTRPKDRRYCELKRLYVYPKARGRQVARKLIQEAIQATTAIGYDEILLDTLPKMQPAIRLYESEGFDSTGPYYFSPLDGVLFFSKKLTISA